LQRYHVYDDIIVCYVLLALLCAVVPYTTLFRSEVARVERVEAVHVLGRVDRSDHARLGLPARQREQDEARVIRAVDPTKDVDGLDRKSTRLNSSHRTI